ncbi:hypothetical protein IDH50_16105 [Aeromicrobium tamlense]|uniref:Carboxypeptidase regulatory-like domain-containing protein n=1 Tax=Aeromicrobium tamlense TaxID=375541 RepID=A0A8I0FW64_9ACTN|nr:hypothetical protein [Aeromicrobium tamlense]MBD1271769.1 hypothetical protein [Aeromicrobium tamlense]NYI39043.1 hypothetical protein [Aeromicrobium tamlense]
MKNATRAAVVAVLAVVASLLIAPSGTAQASSRAAVGTISGRVTAPAGYPGGKVIDVSLRRLSAEGEWVEVASSLVGAGSTYTLGAPTAGTYQVRAGMTFSDSATPSRRITVSKGTRVTGVDLAIRPDPTVSGTITADGFDLALLQPGGDADDRGLNAHVWGRIDGHWERVGDRTRLGTFEGAPVLVADDGRYSFSVPGFYEAVRVQFYQSVCDAWAPCRRFGLAPEVARTYWDGTPDGGPTFAGAADLDVRSGPVVDKDITLKAATKLRAVAEPRIAGTVGVGEVVRARVGSYAPGPTTRDYKWIGQVRGSDRLLARGRTYRVPASLLGHRLALQEWPARSGFEAPVQQSRYYLVKSAARLAVTTKPGKGRATVRLRITAPAVSKTQLHGKASIYAKGKRIKTVKVRNGKATIRITRQARGKRTYTIRYSGNRLVTSPTTSLRIAIR